MNKDHAEALAKVLYKLLTESPVVDITTFFMDERQSTCCIQVSYFADRANVRGVIDSFAQAHHLEVKQVCDYQDITVRLTQKEPFDLMGSVEPVQDGQIDDRLNDWRLGVGDFDGRVDNPYLAVLPKFAQPNKTGPAICSVSSINNIDEMDLRIASILVNAPKVLAAAKDLMQLFYREESDRDDVVSGSDWWEAIRKMEALVKQSETPVNMEDLK